MAILQKKRTVHLSEGIIPFVLLFAALLILLPRTARFAYDYKKGQPWLYETLIAQFDFPIYKSDEQLMQERYREGVTVIPYFRYNEAVTSRSLEQIESLSFEGNSSIKQKTIQSLRFIYAHGVTAEEISRADRGTLQLSEEVLYFVRKDKQAVKTPYSDVYKQSDARRKLLADVSDAFPSENVERIFKSEGVYDILVPNLIFDHQTTEMAMHESASSLSPTEGYVKSGELIVSEGEVVSEETVRILDSYKREYENSLGGNHSGAVHWLGNIILALFFTLLLALTIKFVDSSLLQHYNKVCYICFLFLLMTFLALMVGKNDVTYLCLVPFPLGILYLRTFFSLKTSLPLYIVYLIPLAIFRQNGAMFMSMYLLSGIGAALFYRSTYSAERRLLLSIPMTIVLVVSYLGLRFAELVTGDWQSVILFLFIGSLLTSLGYNLVYLFEPVFGLLSQKHLNDLTNTASPMMREFVEKAPGSFNHCLDVTNLAEYVTRVIGGDVLLVRAGAMCHDLGKQLNPKCFVENCTFDEKEAYHEKLTPEQSAQAIVSHVTDGLVVAEKYRLPDIVKDFILTHHGTTLVQFFYSKYVNAGGNPDNKEPFIYKGKKPQTREQLVLMLCDAVEAASRTLPEERRNKEGYTELVEKIAKGKENEGQFDEANITIRELNLTKEALVEALLMKYHGRIVYPERKN